MLECLYVEWYLWLIIAVVALIQAAQVWALIQLGRRVDSRPGWLSALMALPDLLRSGVEAVAILERSPWWQKRLGKDKK